MNNELNQFCDKVLAKAKINGLEEFEVYGVSGSSIEVGINAGEIDTYSVNDSIGVSFRTKVDGKMGYAATTTLDDVSVDMLINKSKENAEIIEDDDVQFIFEGSEKYQETLSYNEKMQDVSASQIIEIAKSIEKYALAADKRVKHMQQCIACSGNKTTVLKNSKGLSLSRKSNQAAILCSPVVYCGDIANSCYKSEMSLDINTLDAKKLAEFAVEEAIEQCLAQEIPSNKYKVIFRNDVVASILETFASVFSGESAQKGLSLLAGKEGENVASQAFTLIDDGLMDWGFSTKSFDDEGVAVTTKPIIENGVLKTLLHNLKTANKAGIASTGNGNKQRYDASISVSANNLVVKTGDKNLQELATVMNNGIIITDLAGLHSGANAISGDFSLSAKGYLIENGENIQSVSGITVSGNFYDVIKNIIEVGCDAFASDENSATIYTPSILCNDLSIAGK